MGAHNGPGQQLERAASTHHPIFTHAGSRCARACIHTRARDGAHASWPPATSTTHLVHQMSKDAQDANIVHYSRPPRPPLLAPARAAQYKKKKNFMKRRRSLMS